MGQTPDQIRDDIERTRGRMTDTVEAIGYRVDVKERAKDKLREIGDAVSGVTDEVRDTTRKTASNVQRNPVGMAVGGVAAGMLLGLAIPTSRIEDRRLGPAADSVKEKAKEVGQEAIDRGMKVANDAASAAAEVVRDEAPAEAEGLRDTVHEKAAEIQTDLPPRPTG